MIIFCFGTRPEVIKLSPIINELRQNNIPFKTVFSGQHNELFNDVRNLIPPVDYNLKIMKYNQSLNDIFTSVSKKLPSILKKEKAKLIIIQGDTTTVLSSALVAFNESIDIGHVEAGLRTNNINNPFPEEANRQLVSRLAKFNWAPTELACENLKKENVKNIIYTGNTIIDVCKKFNFKKTYTNKILITLHRRENFGDPMKKMFLELEELAIKNSHLEFIFPMHPNPNVQMFRDILKHVNIMNPISYKQMIRLISEVKFVISDSGGIQEECAYFKKKILVCRKTTERPEGINIGVAKLVGDEIKNNFAWANDDFQWDGNNPYGLGKASKKIIKSILDNYEREK